MNKAQKLEEQRKLTEQKLTAMHCIGCPYQLCVGSTAQIDYEAQRRRFRGEEKGDDDV